MLMFGGHAATNSHILVHGPAAVGNDIEVMLPLKAMWMSIVCAAMEDYDGVGGLCCGRGSC